jgi:hypothetical protein
MGLEICVNHYGHKNQIMDFLFNFANSKIEKKLFNKKNFGFVSSYFQHVFGKKVIEANLPVYK